MTVARAALPGPQPASTPAPARAAPAPAAPAAAAAADVARVALEWAARAQCDRCEMLLEVGRFKEAADAAEALLADPAHAKSRYRDLALYHLGHARFALRDYHAAGRALSRLAPFDQEFGNHAHYLLARVHHLSGERPEAAAQYKAVQDAYEARRKAAQEALANPANLAPEQQASLAALVNAPPPEYLFRARLYEALLQTEEGRYAEALERLTALAQQNPKWPPAADARLRIGYCHMQMRNYPQAIQALQPLAEHPQLADQALWWIGRCQAAAADPANPAAVDQAAKRAIATLGRAAERAGALAPSDPDARARRADILMELGDTQQLTKQYSEAAATYQEVLGDKNAADRAEEATERRAAALHLAGKFAESDALCKQFEKTYPTSPLLPAVLFRSAENAYLTATGAADGPNTPTERRDLVRMFGPAIARYDRLLKDFPDFAYADLARQGMATCLYRLGRSGDAIALLSAIPEPQRVGPLATVPYLLADCLLRTFPAETPDAVSAAGLVEGAEQAAVLLEAFAAAQPKSPEAPDALLKLGYCYQRIGGVLADPAERQKRFVLARQAYEKFLGQFPQHPSTATAVFERAKCAALLGNLDMAVAELNRFQGTAVRNAPVAPLAIMRLGTALRAMGKAPEAANVLGTFRQQQEAGILKDPARRDWVPMLQYEHALALKDAGKRPEAVALFEAIAKQFPDRPEAVNATWRVGQCRREEAAEQLAAARAAAAAPGATPDQVAAARKTIADTAAALGKIVASFQAQAVGAAKQRKGSPAHLRLLYETAWCDRVLAEAEMETARQALRAEALARLEAKVKRELEPGQAPPSLRAPDIALSAVPAQPAEKAAIAQYEALIAAGPADPLAVQARFELAELHADRGNPNRAMELLSEALGESPPADLADAIRLRMAAALLAAKNPDAALAQVDKVAANPNSPLAPQAWYLSGEAFFHQKNWAKAIQKLAPFRDQEPFQHVPGISDRALLRLGQAHAQAGQWAPSRATFQALVERFPASPWADEARYGVGWALQNLKAYDEAAAAYAEVTRRTAAEVAARSQLQIGLCRLEQKRYPEAAQALLVVPIAYDYADWNGPAWCQAAQAYAAMNQTDQAVKLWKRVVKDLPKSPWAKTAKERLAAIK